MDLRLMLDRPAEAERNAVDAVLGPDQKYNGRVVYGGHAARARRHLLLPSLHAVQDASGAISRGALAYICDRLTIPPAEAYGVATFYALFNVDGDPGETIHVCDDIVCAQYGGEDLCAALDAADTDYHRSPCLGQCDRAPAAMFHRPGTGYGNAAPVDKKSVNKPVFDELPPGLVHQDPATLTLLRRIGATDPTSIDSYREAGGLQTLWKAREMGPEMVIEELNTSGLRGRGGAAFPIGMKWKGVRDAPGEPKYVIANGDESEPGTFKDRLLMEADPFAVVEAMAVYGYVIGATHGYIYVRGEYPTAEKRLSSAIAQARRAGWFGDSFDLEVRRGAGAYICGEETALFASIEGHRGEPRQKPPFPTQVGVFGKPTGINNIETLLAALHVIDIGGDEFACIGTNDSTGPKLFCVSGAVEKAGVYEVSFGTTLGELLELAGGIRDSKGLGAVLMGGAAGVFVDSSALDLPLTFEDTRDAGTTLGSGAMIFFDEACDFAPVLARIARFFRDESCGQCVPCRIGTVRQEEALTRLAAGSPLGSVDDERQRLDDLAQVMTDASICGLGQTAASAIQSA
ncbi:MAG TPA: NADH-ubiquinone oxidoreductase-F iron-sulfur binding region domain-containing protein, partial [Acidimicrobiia bacterium]|nr:NADH-ubiquinone oxidoreductase-F iron-sulfur binding region domain-containing protein [Acidimicrobiia bacterium]